MIAMMETVSASETLINFYHTTECNVPEVSHSHKMRQLSQISEWLKDRAEAWVLLF
jgi:hypothetical protein